jgi:hypothetical protein
MVLDCDPEKGREVVKQCGFTVNDLAVKAVRNKGARAMVPL